MRRLLAAIGSVFLTWTLVLPGYGQSNPCVGSSETNCTSATGSPFSITALEPGAGWPYTCVGEPVSVTATLGQGAPGLEEIITVDEYCNETITVVPPTILSNWWTSSGPYSGSGTGSNATFTPTTCGTGSLIFYSTYIESALCAGTTNTVAMTNSYTVVGVASLAPTNNTNCQLVASAGALTYYTIPVSTNLSVTRLEILATPCPSITPNLLPECWSLNDRWTNITYINITSPGIFTVICSSGTSAMTNVIWVTEPDGEVEQGCSTNYPALLGYWSFDDTWAGNRDQQPLTDYGLQDPASPWGEAVSIDTNLSANLSYNYIENDGLPNINCIDGAVSFWFKPDWNGATGPGNAGRFLEMGDTNSANGWWSLGVDPSGSILSFQTKSNGTQVTYFSQSIVEWSSNNWYQIVLDYSPVQTLLYTNGALAQTGPGLVNYPNIVERITNGFSIGSDHTGGSQIRGKIDELFIFDCPMTPAQVTSGFPGYNGYPGVLKATFVTASTPNYAAYSMDGVNWTASTMPTTNTWRRMCYGNGIFVASAWVTTNAAYSTNGINWTATSMPVSGYWNALCYGNGVFVALDYNSASAAYTTDGIHWNSASLPLSTYWFGAAYGNNTFVGVAENGSQSVYSTDGVHWSLSTGMPYSANWIGVTYGSGLFAAVAIGNSAAYSADGVNWYGTTMPASASWSSITYGNGVFAAVASGSTTAAYSLDGMHWTNTTMPASRSWQGVNYANGIFVAVPVSSTNAAYSIDGIHWTNGNPLPYSASWYSVSGNTSDTGQDAPPSILTQPASQTVVLGTAATFGVLANGAPTLQYQWQFDGSNIFGATASTYVITNTQATNAGTYSVVVTNLFGSTTSVGAVLSIVSQAAFVAVADSFTSDTNAAYSVDGTNWVGSPAGLPTSEYWVSVTYGNGMYVAIAQDDNAAAYSTDGVNWTASPGGLPFPDAWVSVAYGYGEFVAVDASGDVAYSIDGINWMPSPGLLPSGQWYGVTYGTGTFVAASYDGKAAFSPDGISWTASPTELPGAPAYTGLTFGNGIFAAISSSNNTAYSTDGMHWTAGTGGLPTNSTAWDAASFGNVTYAAIASDNHAAYSTNGITWIASSAGLPGSTNAGYGATAYGTNEFVAIAVNGAAAYSSNGINWSPSPTGLPPSSNHWVAVAGSYASTNQNAAPSIVVQPVGVNTNAGATLTFNVVAIGAQQLTYQWYFNDATALAGATNSSLTLANVQGTNAGIYSVVVANDFGSATSSNVNLTLLLPPVITNQPVGQTVVQGTNVTFTVGASGTALVYQWLFDGTNQLSGDTNATLSLLSVQSTNVGTYSVIVSNILGTAVSEGAALVINSGPAVSGPFPVTNIVVLGSNATFTVTATGSLPLSYQWSFNGTNLLAATNSSYTVYVAQSANAGSYSVQVTNLLGSVTSSSAVLAVTIPPLFTSQPTNLTVNLTSNATFSATVSTNSTPPVSYQWYLNTTNLVTGATNASITITNVQMTNVGFYTVVASNTAGAVSSSAAALTVTIFSSNFIYAPALQINGNAAFTNTSDGDVLELTPSAEDQAGSAFFLTPVSLASNASFSTFFSFRLSKSGDTGAGTNVGSDGHIGADGVVFCAQTLANNVGNNGGGMGYYGLTNSVGVEFDTWWNDDDPTYDPSLPPGQTNANGSTGDGNHVGIDYNGFIVNSNTPFTTNGYWVAERHVTNDLNDSNIWYAWIDYDGTNLELRISETNAVRPALPYITNTVNMLTYLGTNKAFLGFTAATGGDFNQQDILNWQFFSPYHPIGTTNPPPMVAMVFPQNNGVLMTNTAVYLEAGATSFGGVVTNVQFFDGTNLLGTATEVGGSTNYSLAWTTTNVPAGTNSITAVAKDNNGLTGSVTISVIINRAPVVSAGANITTNLPGTGNVTVTLNGSVTDDGWPYHVTNAFWSVVSSNGPVTLGAATNAVTTATFSTNGIYVLQLRGDDGWATNTSTCTVTITRAPVITITSPASNSIVLFGEPIYIRATVSDFDGVVTNVQFFNGTNLLGSVPGESPVYGMTWTNAPSGTNTLTAVAMGFDGLSATSSVTVVVVDLAPTVNAGTNQTLYWVEGTSNISTTLTGFASDDGLPYGTLTVHWTKFSGPGTVTFSPNSNTSNANATFNTNGIYVLKLTASDGFASASSMCTISILRHPFISILSPSNNSSFNYGVPIAFDASAYGLDSRVTNVQFFSGGVNLGTAVSRSTNWDFIWSTAPVGTNVVTAVAWNNYGLTTTSSPVNIIVRSVAVMTVAITQPSSNAVFVAPGVVSISANVLSNANSVHLVNFFANGVQIGQDTVDTVNPHLFTWVGVTASNYNLTAQAVDVLNNTATSSVVPIHVVSPVTANAGTNRTVLLTNTSVTITLQGTYAGGYGAVTTLWSEASGLAPVHFGNAALTNSTATFTNVQGNYMLRLTAGDGYSQASSTVMITVLSNQPPVVNPGPNRSIAPGQVAYLNGAVTDDGLPLPPSLTSWWTVVSGPTNGITFANSNSPVTTASNFSVMGVYTLSLTASDGLSTTTSNMTVTVADPSSRTYTYDADFAEGELVNVNFNNVPNQLQLNSSITPFPFVWIACSLRGTVVRIDANTGQVLGEYQCSPEPMAEISPSRGNPSRTTVDKYGNVWVANRCDHLDMDPTTNGTPGAITRVGIVIGGTRGYKTNDYGGTNFTFVTNANGPYLKPPFKYCTAIDRDGDGLIKTSVGLGNILAWDTNLTGSNNLGGVSLADDECIINYTRVDSDGARMVAVDANNDLWVGGTAGQYCGYANHWHQKISGVTGLPIPNTGFFAGPPGGGGHAGYGGLVDANGVIWSANDIIRIDANRRFDFTVNPPAVIDNSYWGTIVVDDNGSQVPSYGIGIDPNSGNIWVSSGNQVSRIAPDDSHVETFYNPFAYGGNAGGIAVDNFSNVWAASHYTGNYIEHFRTDGTFVGVLDLGCAANGDLNGPTGVAIDANGKVWAACYGSDRAMRVNPNSGPRMLNNSLNPAGVLLGSVDMSVPLDTSNQLANGQIAQPYNYSDMTGFVSLGATEPSGVWSVVHDSSIQGETWGIVQWDQYVPANTGIKVEVRASDNYTQLTATNNLFVQVTNNIPFNSSMAAFSNVFGRYIQIRATFTHNTVTNATPILYDLTVSSGTVAVTNVAANFANSDQAAMLENGPPLVINVLSNDVAPSGHPLTITQVSPASSGYVTISTNGTYLIYTPNTNFFGVDQFSYTATDGQGAIGRAVVTVEVGQVLPIIPGAGAPIASSTNVIILGNSTNNPIDVLALCADTNSPPLADPNVYIQSLLQPSNGFVQVSSCYVYYTPNFGYFGPDSFSYTIRNSAGLTATTNVNITVTGQPAIPIGCGSNVTAIMTTNNSTFTLFDGNGSTPICANTYTFAGVPNETMTFTVSSQNDAMSFWLYSPDTQTVTQEYSSPFTVTAQSTGTYTLEVDCDENSLQNSSNYDLSVSCTAATVPYMAVFMGTNLLPNGGGIDFGVTTLGTPVPAYLTITNYGMAELNVMARPFIPDNGNFVISDSTLGTEYTWAVVPAGGSTNLTVWYEALVPGQTNEMIELYGQADDGTKVLDFTNNLTGRANPTNNIPPTVAITNPLPNSTFVASQVYNTWPGISITAVASAAPGATIWGVNFYALTTNGNIAIDQELTPDGNGNYTFENWHAVPPGTYQLTAVAIDNAGLQTISAAVPITVELRDTNSPHMEVLFGTTNLPDQSTLNFGVTAVNVPVSATVIVTNLGPGTLNNCTLSTDGNPPYSFTNSPFTLAAGQSTNVTVVFDSSTFATFANHLYFDGNDEGLYGPFNNNQQTGRLTLNLTGTATNTGLAPTIYITNPAPAAVFYSPSSIPLQAVASNLSGAGSFNVEFYATSTNGTLDIGSAYFDSSTGFYETTWYNVPLGSFTLQAEASDSSGLATVSVGVPITVAARPATSPILQVLLNRTNAVANNGTIVYPATSVGNFSAATIILSNTGNASLTVSNITVSSGSDFTLTTSPITPFTILAGHCATNVITFSPSSAPNNESATWTITDNDDANSSLTVNLSGYANPAGTPPSISITAPPANTNYVAWEVNYRQSVMTFSAYATPSSGATVTAVNFYISDTNGNSYQIGSGGTTDNRTFTVSSDYNNGYWGWYTVVPGRYLLTAVAIDDSNRQSNSLAVPFTVSARDTNSPIMEVFLGTNNLTDGSTINFGVANDNTTNYLTLMITNVGSGSLTNTNIYVYSGFDLTDPTVVGMVLPPDTGTNIQIEFDPTSVGLYNGGYFLFIGNDMGQGPSYSPGQFSLNLIGDATNGLSAPSVSLTNPPSGTVYVLTTNPVIQLYASATANDAFGLSHVDFYAATSNGNSYIGSSYGSGPSYSYNWNNPLPSPGQYSLTAVAIGNNGESAVSAAVPITVLLRPTNSPIMAVYFAQTNPVPNDSTISYGISEIGSPLTNLLTISNVGNTTLNLSRFILTDTNDFTLTYGFALPVSIAPGTATNITVTYTALDPGTVTSVLTIYDNDMASQPFYLTNTGSANLTNAVAPVVVFNIPVTGSQYAYPSDVGLQAVALCPSNDALANVTFYMQSPSGNVQIAQVTASGGETNLVASATWSRPAPGNYTLFAIAEDHAGLLGQSSNVYVQIVNPNGTNGPSTNGPPIARDDQIIVQGVISNTVTYPIYPLANDSSPSGFPLTLTSFTYSGRLGQVTQQGNTLLFTPYPLYYGTNLIYYTISDGRGGTATAYVTVVVTMAAPPTITFVSPTDGAYINLETTNLANRFLPLVAQAAGSTNSDATNVIANVQFYDQDQLLGTVTSGTNGIFTLNWLTPAAGPHYLAALANDNVGNQALTPYISIYIAGNTNDKAPIAAITNLQMTKQDLGGGTTSEEYPLITNGIVTVLGNARATGANAPNDIISYQLLLQNPDGSLVANITPGYNPATGYVTATDNNGVLASNVDLSLYQNGVYDIVLNVFDGWLTSSDSARILLNSQLKIGNFSFSVQDISLPVSGIPLTVTRTYNSFNLNQDSFGYSWTYAINDIDLTLDEVRQDTPDIDSDTFSLRVGGGRDVTMTLPNGQVATFQFYMDGPYGYNYNAAFHSPPGCTYTLTTLDGDYYESLTGYWDNEDGTGFDSFDFSGFVLTALDGTKYIMPRQNNGDYFYASGADGSYSDDDDYVNTYGAATLSEIIEPNGDTIQFNADEVDHYNAAGVITRSVRFQRDGQNRIIGILDPNAGSNGLPTMKYVYDTNGNLVNAMRLQDTNTGVYDVTSYQYTNVYFPHFITGIVTPNGAPLAENFYDSSGRLTAMQDASGNLTQFINNQTNNIEVIVDRLGRTNTSVYDLNGNVIAETNAIGQVTLKSYDQNHNKTNQVAFLNGLPYATNSFLYDQNNLLLSITDPLGHTMTCTYDSAGNMLTSTDARGDSTTNTYDAGNNLLTKSDALGNVATYSYSQGMLISSVDPTGTSKINYYDGFQNMIGSVTLDSSGTIILATNAYTYDLNGNQTTATTWRRVNGVWTPSTMAYIYDAMNRVVQTINPDGGTNSVVYNAMGQQQAAIDPLGRTTSFAYDNEGRLIQTTYPDMTVETSAYDAVGNCTNSTDRLGRSTASIYDALNRQVETIYPDGTTNTTIYDQLSRTVERIDARGIISGYAYDDVGRMIASTNAAGTTAQAVSSFGYDANNNRITFTDANNHTTTNIFDALNRKVEVLLPDGTATGTLYDGDGRRVAQTNQDKLVTQFAYDGCGRLLAVTNAANLVTLYQYDESGNETAQVDSLSRTNAFIYDLMGHRICHILPGHQFEGMTFDLAGNLIYQTNCNGAVITNQYDLMNRLLNEASSGGYHAGYTYTATGQRASMADVSGLTSYAYDSRDRLLLKTVSWNGGPTVSLNYGYDPNGTITQILSSTTNGANLVYSYDPQERLTNVQADGNIIADYGFDAVGNVKTFVYENGVTNQCQFDSLNRLTNLTATTVSGVLASFYYQLDPVGVRTNSNESINGSSRVCAWKYDALYRMTNENMGSIGSVGYAYDAVGNRTNRSSTIAEITNQAPTYNANDWLSNDAYDNDGSTIASYGNVYGYDVWNHLTNVNNGAVILLYDGDGNRVSKTVGGITTYFLVDDRNPTGYAQILEEYQNGTLSEVYNYGLNLISQVSPGSATNYFTYDGRGSTRVLTGMSGNVVNAFTYDGYGTLVASNGVAQTAYLYCGQQYDQDLKLYYNRARYLNQNNGRFWTVDTYEGNNEDPLSLHKYLYCEADPINGVDPSGHQDLISLMCSIAIGDFVDSMDDVGAAAVDVAVTAHIVDIYACMRKFYKKPRKEGNWRIHFWVYANQPSNAGIRYDIDFDGPTWPNVLLPSGNPGKLTVTSDTLPDVKSESWCYKVASLNELQYIEWNAFVGVDAATLDYVEGFVGKSTYSFTYWLGAAGAPDYLLQRALSESANCLIFTMEASIEARLISLGR